MTIIMILLLAVLYPIFIAIVAKAAPGAFLAMGVVGGPDTVRAGLQALARDTRADEFMLVSDVFDPALRLRSLTLTAQATIAG